MSNALIYFILFLSHNIYKIYKILQKYHLDLK